MWLCVCVATRESGAHGAYFFIVFLHFSIWLIILTHYTCNLLQRARHSPRVIVVVAAAAFLCKHKQGIALQVAACALNSYKSLSGVESNREIQSRIFIFIGDLPRAAVVGSASCGRLGIRYCLSQCYQVPQVTHLWLMRGNSQNGNSVHC